MGAIRQKITAEEFWQLYGDQRRELVDGEVVELTPPGGRHGLVAAETCRILTEFAHRHGLGRVFIDDTGFLLHREPDIVRGADVAFMRRERLPDPVPDDFIPGAPDLAVEVVSPGDRAAEIERKVQDYLQAGTALVWVIYPVTKTAVVHRAGSVRRLQPTDVLDGEEVLPGLTVPLRELFR